MMFRISVITDGSAELARKTIDYSHLNSLPDSSKKVMIEHTSNEILTFCI